jgi:hypothetical protein
MGSNRQLQEHSHSSSAYTAWNPTDSYRNTVTAAVHIQHGIQQTATGTQSQQQSIYSMGSYRQLQEHSHSISPYTAWDPTDSYRNTVTAAVHIQHGIAMTSYYTMGTTATVAHKLLQLSQVLSMSACCHAGAESILSHSSTSIKKMKMRQKSIKLL